MTIAEEQRGRGSVGDWQNSHPDIQANASNVRSYQLACHRIQPKILVANGVRWSTRGEIIRAFIPSTPFTAAPLRVGRWLTDARLDQGLLVDRPIGHQPVLGGG